MTLSEGMNFLASLANDTVKSKYFTMDSLTSIAFLKKKIKDAIDKYNERITEIKVKVGVSKDGQRFIPLDESPEAKKDFKDFTDEQDRLLKADIENLKTNFVTQEEMKKVTEDTTLEVATNLIIHLMVEK